MALSGEEWMAIALSLKIALVATACSLPFAVAVAWLLARRDFPGKTIFDAIIHLPLVLPPVVTGFALLVAFGRHGFIGAPLERLFGISFAFRWTGAALAAAVMGFPLMVRPIRQAFEAVDPRLERAAGSLGAPPLWRFAVVTLPLAAPGVAVGVILGFAKALGEFGATITFVSNIPGETRTIASEIWTQLQSPGGEAAALRLSLIAAGIAVCALAASEMLARRAARRSAQ
ncbi:MAG: molybdate ABC transporter permease subunit [Hyphomicrobiales bacterium]|nr:molybdate ABC transporter permease subunit [Hyphomicrobiales bacterium]